MVAGCAAALAADSSALLFMQACNLRSLCWQAFQLYLQLMSILATLNVEWPAVLGRLFTACGYATNLTPQVSMVSVIFLL